jgi:hypothetical protein
LQAARLRHVDVEQHQVGRVALKSLQRALAIDSSTNVVARLHEREPDQRAQIRIIVGNQDSHTSTPLRSQ